MTVNWCNWCSSSFPCLTTREGQLESLLALLPYLSSVPLLCLLSMGRVCCLVTKARHSQLRALPALTYKWNLHLFTTASKYKQGNSPGSQYAAAWVSEITTGQSWCWKSTTKTVSERGPASGKWAMFSHIVTAWWWIARAFPKPGSRASVHLYYLLWVSEGVLPY